MEQLKPSLNKIKIENTRISSTINSSNIIALYNY